MTEATEPEKRVEWAELFFDLVFVFAITQITQLLHADHSPSGLLRSLIVFIPVYWAWVGTAIQTNLRDMSRAGSRLAIFAVGLGGLFMALSVGDAYAGRGLLFGASYWGARLILWLMTFAHGKALGLSPITVSMFLTGPLLVGGGLCPPGTREVIWGIAAVIDLSTPLVLSHQLRGMHYHAAHLSERFGAFVLIALGESVVAIGAPAAAATRLDAATLVAVTFAFALCCGAWWVYFHFASDAMRHALATAQVQLNVTRHVLSYGHLLLIAAIVAVAVGMTDTISNPGAHLQWPVAGLLFGGAALYLATFGYTRWMMFRLVSTTRLTAAAVVVLCLPIATKVPALVCLGLLAAILAGLNVAELLRVRAQRRASIALQ